MPAIKGVVLPVNRITRTPVLKLPSAASNSNAAAFSFAICNHLLFDSQQSLVTNSAFGLSFSTFLLCDSELEVLCNHETVSDLLVCIFDVVVMVAYKSIYSSFGGTPARFELKKERKTHLFIETESHALLRNVLRRAHPRGGWLG